jgi:hypothetical protein
MKFSEEQSHKVKLHLRDLGDMGEARLRFGGERGVVARIRESAGKTLKLRSVCIFNKSELHRSDET